MTDRISVVIPLYNKGPYIKRAIESALLQTSAPLEVIVVDDGSSDGGDERVANMSDRRIRLVRQPNAGVSAARNRGIRESSGNLVAFLDADDEWMPDFLSVIGEMRNDFPEAGSYSTAYVVSNANGMLYTPSFHGISQKTDHSLISDYFECATFSAPPICSSAVVIPKTTFTHIGLFREGEANGEDLDMWGRIALEYPIAFSRKPGAIYHKEAENRASSKYRQDNELPFVTFGKAVIKNKIQASRTTPYLREYIARIQIESIKQNIASGNKKAALRSLTDCETKVFHLEKMILKLMAHLPSMTFNYAVRIKQSLKNLFIFGKR